MANDEISATNSVILQVLRNQIPTSTEQSTTALYRLLNTAPTTIAPDQTTPIQQASALAVNESLSNLNFVASSPIDALLINEINPNIVAFLEAQELTPAQQAALTVNETIQNLAGTDVQASTLATSAATTSVQNLTPGPQDALLNPTAAAADTETAVETQNVNLTGASVTPTQTTPTTTTTETTIPGATLTTFQPIVDRNPIAVPVYEIRDQKPLPSEPKPRAKRVFPPTPIGRVRPVDRLALRQEWEKRKENRQQEEVRPPQSLEERSIREMISRANEDLTANGLPLRLVLAKDDEGYRLDIYDCSFDEECRLSHDVRLDLNKLVTILDNIQHETGIIVNVMT